MLTLTNSRQQILSLPVLAVFVVAVTIGTATMAANEQLTPSRPWLRPSQRAANRLQAQPVAATAAAPANAVATSSVVEVAPPANAPAPLPAAAPATISSGGGNRTTRTADVFRGDGDGFNIVVTHTCERESMKLNIRTSRPFYGVIHTRNQRQKPGCSVEGNGEAEYELEISDILNPQDPAYCGVVRAPRVSAQDKDILSVVVAVRVHRNIELSDDKFFMLNCTNRCRKPDCSSPSAKLSESEAVTRAPDFPEGEREATPIGGAEGTSPGGAGGQAADECTVWKFPQLITLLWVMGILLLASIISHCIMCSSLVCRCVRKEVEEREPSVYEGATDCDEDDLYNKRHPYRIDYDNKDIYRTTNNYAPYSLDDTQSKSRHKSKRSSGR